MKKLIAIIILALIFTAQLTSASTWTEETARQEAFKNIQRHIEVFEYATFDPDFQENQNALQSGQTRVSDRFITRNNEPPIGYVVSKLDAEGRPMSTMFYKSDGRLISVRLFSSPAYPRISYIYCVSEEDCRAGGKEYKIGELMSVSLRVSEDEEFYFLPDGKCTGRVTF